VRALEQQIEEFLRSLAIEPRIETWILEQIALDEEKLKDDQKAQQKSRETALQGVEQQLNELTGLRVRNLLSDAEFVARRSEMQKELIRLRQHSEVHDEPAHPIEPVADVISFNNRAAEWFATGDDHIKRTILEIVGSNPILRGKILSIEAKKPFLLAAKMRDFSNMLGVGDDVRTNHTKYDLLRQVAHEVAKSLLDEDGKKMLLSIRKLREQFEPAVLAKQVFEQACRARAAARAGRARGADDSSHSPPLL
jgi:hypothetical protein